MDTATRRLELPNNPEAKLDALFTAVRFLASFVERRPEWGDERDKLLAAVAEDVEAGIVDPHVYAFLFGLLVGTPR